MRGFSLVELMAASAIAAVIMTAATGAVMSVNRTVAEGNKRAFLLDESKRLEEYIIARLQGAGGGSVRPSAAVLVEEENGTGVNACRTITNMPACTTTHSDRLTIATQNSSYPTCSVTSQTSGILTVADDTPGHCCLDATSPLTFEKQQVLLVGTAGVVSLYVSNKVSGQCKIGSASGQANGMLATALASAGFPATMVVVSVETLFTDTASHTLKSWTDNGAGSFINNGAVDAGEIATLDDQVYDLQVAMGYDGLPEDGVVTDANSSSDEWLFNAASDPSKPGTGAFLSVSTSQLRMMQVALAVGAAVQNRSGNTIQLLNGPQRSTSGIFLTTTSSKAYLRNLNLFTQ